MTYKYGLGVALIALAGCASSYPTPTAHMAQATASVGVADGDSAQGNLQVTRYLMRANEELSDARRLTESGRNQRADLMFLRADADAKLATALARAQRYEEGAKNAKGPASVAAVAAAAAAAQRGP